MGNAFASKPKVPVLIETVLDDVYSFFTTLRAVYVIRPDVSVIAFSATDDYKLSHGIALDKKRQRRNPIKLPEGTVPAIEGLKKTATSFGTSLFHGDSQIMHIRGKHQMFSYYAISDTGYALVLYSELSSNTLDIPDTSILDDDMAKIIKRIADILRTSDKK